MFGQSVLDAPNEPAPVEREAIPENERDFPIHYLLRTHRYAAVLDLLPVAADLNEPDREGRTLLTIAAEDQSEDAHDMVKALLDRGADPQQQDGRGNAPLYYAAGAGTLAVVELLVDRYGADVNRQSIDPETGEPQHFRTPVSAAAEGGQLQIIRFLESRGAEAVPEHMPILRMMARYQSHRAEMTNFIDDPPPDMTEAEIARALNIAGGEALARAMQDLGAPKEVLEYHRSVNRALLDIGTREPHTPNDELRALAETEVRKSIDREAYLKANERWAATLLGSQ